mgnify:CR=1 FL=1
MTESDERGEFWRCTLIETETRLRVGRGIGKTETDASVQALSMLKERSQSDQPPALTSDGWGGHREALIDVYGQAAHRPGSSHNRTGNICRWSSSEKMDGNVCRLL